MSSKETMRIAKSFKALDKVLTKIEKGEKSKPDWIRLQGDCRLEKLSEEERQAFLARMHKCVLRGFKNSTKKVKGKKPRLALWKSIAQSGFHDFSEFGWTKMYDSPFVENYDYITDYQQGGIPALDPYKVYSSVLGTFEFGVADFVATKLCKDVKTLVEPMAGTAEFCYSGHFQFPDHQYMMIDLDPGAKELVLSQNWLEQTSKEYILGDVLSEDVWAQVKSQSTADSLAYVGKQSHHYFSSKEMFDFMKVATDHVDFLMLETPQICLVSEMGDTDELTRQEQEDAGFKCELVEEKWGEPNPLTHKLSFRLEARKGDNRKTMFNYHNWTAFGHGTLVSFAEILDLKAFYYHSEEEEFLPVAEWNDECDCEDNVTFMLFTKRNV